MTSKPSETVVRVWVRLMKAQQRALAAIEQDLKSAALPPLAWYDVLWELERAGDDGLRPFELQRTMLLEQYNLSRLIDRIEQAGYVARRACAEDGRGHLVAITDRGKAVRRKMWPIYARAIQSALGEHLSGAQADALDVLLGRLVTASDGS
jgi:DNA-binding MarR family transcriptional regulator